ncbi:HD domain-containing phosphohydrolase [Saccharibacillus sp. CPCC 101409]|uniref:HD domain-containing phosphohydrolase n=1 Tax=Saccharibacillus sp. CPCC 101409 TaxID=3058041 RepID=UPI0026721B55|nr:HD domain-containing phosphohydrolase [Saccharibacillus sp. CPCC 101409]MDO3409113.1 HD domain-containing phosphohydrolase [Saccharibacillus sp. CPCC 101409]
MNAKIGYYPAWTLAGCLYGALLAMGSGQVNWTQVLPILAVTLLLDLFPIRLISGDEFGASLIGYLSLLIGFGPYTAAVCILISCLVNELRQSRLRLPLFDPARWMLRTCIYTVCMLAAALVVRLPLFDHASIYVQAAAVALAYKCVKIPLTAVVRRAAYGTPIIAGIRNRLREAPVPILLCIVVIPHFLENLARNGTFYELAYTGLLLFFILYFSRVYLREVTGWRRTFERFALLFEERLSPDMEGHGRRTGVIADHVLDSIAYPREKKRDFIQVAIQHDIGKSALPAYLFNKRGALSLSEEREYQSHSEKGADIIRTIMQSDEMAKWVRHHHERYDGKGFPDGLKGEEIPYESRILALCSRLEHLLRQETDDEKVAARLNKLAGKELDPALAGAIDRSFLLWLRDMLAAEPASADSAPKPAQESAAEVAEEESGSFVGTSAMLKLSSDGLLYGLEQPALEESLVPLARRAESQQVSFYEILRSEGKTYEAHFYPEHGEVRIVLTDITPAIAYREKLNEDTLRSYREVIGALSEGRVTLCLTAGEVSERLGGRLDLLKVEGRPDVGPARDMAARFMPADDPKRSMKVKLAVSEAATNLLKHATGGEVTVLRSGDSLQVLIRDQGSGIPLHELPKTFLVGYSSKRSLGRGFAVMYASAERVFLYTDRGGTLLLMEFDDVFPAAEPARESELSASLPAFGPGERRTLSGENATALRRAE